MSSTPTISQVYAAFDESSHGVFRRAMHHSRGGVVRVADLAAALAERAPEISRAVLRPLVLPVPSSGGQEEVPMANEPALRELLRQAFVIASEQPGTAEPVITPAVLLAALALQDPWSRTRLASDVFTRLDLVPPVGWQQSPVVLSAANRVASPPSENPVTISRETADPEKLVLEILQRWLEAGERDSTQARDQKMKELSALVRGLNS